MPTKSFEIMNVNNTTTAQLFVMLFFFRSARGHHEVCLLGNDVARLGISRHLFLCKWSAWCTQVKDRPLQTSFGGSSALYPALRYKMLYGVKTPS